jgi:hypothetical protein
MDNTNTGKSNKFSSHLNNNDECEDTIEEEIPEDIKYEGKFENQADLEDIKEDDFIESISK